MSGMRLILYRARYIRQLRVNKNPPVCVSTYIYAVASQTAQTAARNDVIRRDPRWNSPSSWTTITIQEEHLGRSKTTLERKILWLHLLFVKWPNIPLRKIRGYLQEAFDFFFIKREHRKSERKKKKKETKQKWSKIKRFFCFIAPYSSWNIP